MILPCRPMLSALAECINLGHNCSMKIGYVRVLTDDQDPDVQVAALERTGAEKIYKDHGLSGTTTKRYALLRCPKDLTRATRLSSGSSTAWAAPCTTS